MTSLRDRQLLRAYATLTCEACGEPFGEQGPRHHIREECTKTDPVAFAHMILERQFFLDAHAEIVAAAYLTLVKGA